MNNATTIKTKRAPGIKDVARRANVSIATVSNVLNGTKAVSDPLKERVLNAVEELDYRANPLGRNLKNGRTNSVAVIIPSITSVFFPPLIKSLQRQAEAEGFSLMLFSSSGKFHKEKDCINEAVSHGVDGIFISSCASLDTKEGAEYIENLAGLTIGGRRIHVICLESAISSKLDSVEADDRVGTIAAVNHLISRGCQKIAYIAAPQNYQMGIARKKGYLDALQENGLEPDSRLITEGNYTPISGYQCMRELLSRFISFDGIACGNDQMAIGAIRAIKEAGLSIPDDIAVVGYNDNAPSALISPSLTTMHVPKTEMGSEAFRLFLRRIQNPDANPMRIRLTTDLVIRNSTDPEAITSWDLTGW